jgi:hypothetical protein
MASRRELEALIVFGLKEVWRLETILRQQWETIETASEEARASFLWSLTEFEQHTSRLEKLVDALDNPADAAAPLAA